MAIQPTDLLVRPIQGSEAGMLATWTFWEFAHVDHFEAQWQYYNGAQRKWITESARSVADTSWVPKVAANGHGYRLFQDTYNAPSGANYESIRVRVRAIAANHKVQVGTNKDGSAKYENRPWWSPTAWVTSESVSTNWQLGAPNPPTNVVGTLDGTAVKLTWTVNDERVTHVAVWRSVDGGPIAKIAGLEAKSAGSYKDTQTGKGHVYGYRLKSYSSKSKRYSALSEAARIEEPPLAPINLSAKLYGEDSVLCEWEKQGTSGTSYVLSYADDPNAFGNYSQDVQTIDTDHTRVTVTSLERGKTWYFRVQSRSVGGLSVYSKPQQVTLSPDPETIVTTPTTPTLHALYWDAKMGALKAICTAEGAKYGERWEMTFSTVPIFTTDASLDVTVESQGYNIRTKGGEYVYGDTASGWTSVGKGVIYAMTNVTPGSTYYARVRRSNGKKWSVWSTYLNCLVPAQSGGAAAPTMRALVADGAYIRAALTVPTSAAESVELQVSTVSAEFSDTGVRTITYDGGWRTIYSDGEMWKCVEFVGATARGTGIVVTITDPVSSTRHWVRARTVVAGNPGQWSSALDVVAPSHGAAPDPTEPPMPPRELAAAVQEGAGENVTLTFADPFDPAEAAKFEFEWTSNARAFADNAVGDIKSATWEPESAQGATQETIARAYTVTSLERGLTWYFRVRKANAAGSSPWATAKTGESYSAESVAQCFLPSEAEALSAPTTVATDANAAMGSTILLMWSHSSEQKSDQTAWQVEVTNEGGTLTRTYQGTGADSSLALALEDGEPLALADGDSIGWRVRTQGVVDGVWSPWSGTRTVSVWSAPVVGITLTDATGAHPADDEPLTMLPLHIGMGAGGTSAENEAVAWWGEVVSAQAYDAIGADGTQRTVYEGEVMWSGTAVLGDPSTTGMSWSVSLYAEDLSLASGMTYVVRGGCTSAMGLRSVAVEQEFITQWASGSPQPSATVTFDAETYEAHIWPRCAALADSVSPDDADGSGDVRPWAVSTLHQVRSLPSRFQFPDSVQVDQGHVTVRYDDADLPEGTWYLDVADRTYVVITDEAQVPLMSYVDVIWEGYSEDMGGMELLVGAMLSVWRIEADGTLTLVADGVENDGNAEVIDPHARFGTAAYRIVATHPTTGLSGSTDVEVESDVDSIVLTWGHDARSVELPYNVRTSESRQPEAALVSYSGRSNPVAYRGTQRGESGSWSTELIKDVDVDRLALLREAVNGDCYVREPSGAGYWAFVSMKVEHSYQTASVGVSLDVTRIETPAGEVA